MLKLCLTVILLGCVTQINCENLPVFIWGQKTPSFLPALSHLNGDEFVTLVKSQTDKDTLTVVFVENNLSVEDLSQCKLKTETCFQNLRKIQQKTYLTAVDDPVKALEAVYGQQKQKSITVSNDGDLSGKLDADGNERIIFVYLDDAESSEDFAKHDELMTKLFNSIASKRGDGNVIAIYTARHPSFVYSKPLVRKARDTEGKAEGDAEPIQRTVLGVGTRFLFAFNSFNVTAANGNVDVIDISTLALSTNATGEEELTEIDATLKDADGTHNLGIKMSLSAGTWEARFTYNDKVFFPEGPVTAYDNKSYGCGNLTLSDVTSRIIIEEIQMQPLFSPDPENLTRKLTQFSDRANDCIGFYSPAIWGALFVVIILLMILSTGLAFILDINTMDRFDDPKGKTITINAQE